MGEARDWDTGLPLKHGMLGKMSKLEVHHIFPKKILYAADYRRPEVNAVANFCFLTKDTNLKISASKPENYFPEIASKHPGALESQWIPMDEQLWKVENYREFLEARRQLLADATNAFLADLYSEHAQAPEASSHDVPVTPADARVASIGAEVVGGVDSEEEEQLLMETNEWLVEQGLPEGEYLYELSDAESGQPLAIFDLAWPDGLQTELSERVALLLDEGPEVLSIANAMGYRYFTKVDDFKQYVHRCILADDDLVA